MVAKEAIYNNPVSPYRKLLELAGCELGDLESLVRNEGIEAALLRLYRQGVYLTVSEAKGREPVVRGRVKFSIRAEQLAKPKVAGALISQSGGSRGSRTPVPIDLELDRIRSADMFLDFEARGGIEWVRAIWAVPGTASLRRIINYTLCGAPPDRWFSVVHASGGGFHHATFGARGRCGSVVFSPAFPFRRKFTYRSTIRRPLLIGCRKLYVSGAHRSFTLTRAAPCVYVKRRSTPASRSNALNSLSAASPRQRPVSPLSLAREQVVKLRHVISGRDDPAAIPVASTTEAISAPGAGCG